MTDWIDQMEQEFQKELDQAKKEEAIGIMHDPFAPVPTMEEKVTFRSLPEQMEQVDRILKLERARAQVLEEEEILYTGRSEFIRAAIARELRRYKEHGRARRKDTNKKN